MEFGEILGYVVTALGGGGIATVFNWRINKNKAKEEVNIVREEVKSNEIENIKKQVEVYQTIIADLRQMDAEKDARIKEQLADKDAKINDLMLEIKQLREDKLQSELGYQRQIQSLQRQIVDITKALGIKANERVRDEKTGRYIKGE